MAKYLKQYNRNQYVEKTEIENQQLYFLKKLLQHAYNRCPFYKGLYDQHHINYRIENLTDFSQFPTISKQDLVDHKLDLSAGLNKCLVSIKTTGGSSGHPVTILKNVDALARERAATWRSYAWAGVSVGDPQARFWGVPLLTKNRFKYRIIDFIANRIRLSAFDITESSLTGYYEKINQFKPSYLYGYVSMIDLFGQFMDDNGLHLPGSVTSIITTSEMLTGQVRRRLEKNLQRNVYNEYGCGEVGSIAHECQCHSMHIMADNLIVEVDGEEIIVTDLHNYAMPLIRYRLNDFGKISYEKCACGCRFPVLENIYGRAYDMIKLPNGKTAHPEIVMYVFEELKEQSMGLVQFQFVQQAVDKAVINLVVNGQFEKNAVELQLKRRLEDVLGTPLLIKFNYRSEIEREPSGKIRLVKSDPGLLDEH